MITELLIKPARLTLGGESWPALITYGVLLDCENVTSADLFGNTGNLINLSARVLQGLVWAVLKRAGAGLTLREAGAMVTHRNLGIVRAQLTEAFSVSMPEPEKVSVQRSEGALSKTPEQLTRLDVWAAATSKYGLALPENEWLEMTPRQLHALRQVHIGSMQREELMFSRLIAATKNYSQRAPTKLVPDDCYMFHRLPESQKTELAVLTGEDIMNAMAPYRGKKQIG